MNPFLSAMSRYFRRPQASRALRGQAKRSPKNTHRRLNLERLEDRVAPATITVTNALDDGSAGSLRAVISLANTDAANGVSDSIRFDSSLAGATIVLGQGQFELSGAGGGMITVDGRGLSTPITISGNHASRVFRVDAGVQAVFESLIITQGKLNGMLRSDNGGGIDNSGTLTVKNSSFTDNSAYNGGGINNLGTLTVDNSTFTGNHAVKYGGGFADSDYGSGTQTFTHCTFANNSALDGGGINSGGSLTVSDCSFAGNTVADFGGALAVRLRRLSATVAFQATPLE